MSDQLHSDSEKCKPSAPAEAPYSFRGWWSNDEKDISPEPWETFCVALLGIMAGDIATKPEAIEEILAASGKRILIVDRDVDKCTDSPAPRVLKADADRLAKAMRQINGIDPAGRSKSAGERLEALDQRLPIWRRS